MSKFTRNIKPQILYSLKTDNLFTQKLLKNCQSKKSRSFLSVFPAFRNDLIDFYYRGGRPFEYGNGGFKSHYKYVGLLSKPKSNTDYIADGFSGISFYNGYERILENSFVFANQEAQAVSDIYGKHSYVFSKDNIVVLDIEVAFEKLPSVTSIILESDSPAETKRKGIDRIDLLLFDKQNAALQFVEVKLHNNPELRLKAGVLPPIVEQITRYEKQIHKKYSEILTGYKNYISYANTLFGLTLPEPSKINEQVTLLVTAFDNDQENGALHIKHKTNIESHYNKVTGKIMKSKWKGAVKEILLKTLF